MIWVQLFFSFFKIGVFGFGGGYAMLSMIQGEVVLRHGWLTAQEFSDFRKVDVGDIVGAEGFVFKTGTDGSRRRSLPTSSLSVK